MKDKLVEKSSLEFTDILASKAPVPGGGGVAALVGAYGAALCAMAGNLTVGKKKYAAVEADIYEMIDKCSKHQKKLLELVDEDAKMFEPLSQAYAISKDSPNRDKILEEATLTACQAPMDMMIHCCEMICIQEEMLEKGSALLVSDVGCSALCSVAALESAAMNVFINTKTMKNRSVAEKVNTRVEEMLKEYIPRARKVAEETMTKLRTRI